MAAPHEQRKVVTVVFCDVTDSTTLGEQLDPEPLRALLARFFQRMSAIVGAHGGTVEKFIGDAVMAVFGVPRLHEDDALRACRAAAEMRDALPSLGITGRVGVATGEVVVGTEERLATGAAVNLAARLEQAAEPGDVLISAATLRLVRGVAETEPVDALALHGLGAIRAYRLLTVGGEPPARRPRTALVGRATELRRLDDVFAQAVHDGSCQLFTLLGAAGIGKSRLAAEFLSRIGARVVHGRCLSYGEGITYWPVTEIVGQLAAQAGAASAVAETAALLGETEQPTEPRAIASAFQQMLESAAVEAPLVCLFDDLQWAEPPVLDLVEHVADLSRGAAILLLCLARPELLDRRATWGGGKMNATTLLLEPLSPDESLLLLDRLGGADDDLREQIVARAEGNPLFLEEMLALARHGSSGEAAVPPTIQALLAARLDQLDPADRAVLERGAVEGLQFHQQAVETLGDADDDVEVRLQGLVRRTLIAPAKPMLVGPAYRFRHQLIRDAAYDGLPKTVRADLHRRFATWLAACGETLIELDELVGYHLEQTCRYLSELGEDVPAKLAADARRRLQAGGRRAYLRGDYGAALNLFRRALALGDPGHLELELELDVGWALVFGGDWPGGYAHLGSAASRAAAGGDGSSELCLRLLRAVFGIQAAVVAPAELDALVAEALPRFEAGSDHLGLHLAHTAAFHVAGAAALADDMRDELSAAIEEAHLAGLIHRESWLRLYFGKACLDGNTPASELLAWCDDQLGSGNRSGLLPGLRAAALARLGREEEARAGLAAVRDALRERGGRAELALAFGVSAEEELLLGNHADAAALGATACDLFEQVGQRAALSYAHATVAQAAYALGDLDAAARHAGLAEEAAVLQDAQAQSAWRGVRAKLLASAGDRENAARLAREAVEILERTQLLSRQACAYADLAETLLLVGDAEGARDALEIAIERHGRKENLVATRRARTRLSALPAAAAASRG